MKLRLTRPRQDSCKPVAGQSKNDVLAFCGPVRPRDDMMLMVVAREG
jgi:hypothetical protein